MTQLRIDFVSDISCPWCALGLASLSHALNQLAPEITAQLYFQPFELNPDLPAGGVDFAQHMAHKGYDAHKLAASQETLSMRGAELGVHFDFNRRGHIYNTFDAHRLLHWAGLEGRQEQLKLALFKAYFTDGANVGDHATLARIAGEAGLDPARAQAILASDEFAREVREQERHFTVQGIQSVPSVIINGRYLIQGGQPPEAFEQALRQIANSPPPATNA